MINRSVYFAVAVLLLSACGGARTASNADGTASGPRIAFLQLHITDSTAVLVNITASPGTLKSPRVQPDWKHIIYEHRLPSGEVAWSGDVDDPLVRQLEYEDPGHPGQLASKIVRSGEGDLTIRIPYREGASSLDLYRINTASDGGGNRVHVGHIDLELQ